MRPQHNQMAKEKIEKIFYRTYFHVSRKAVSMMNDTHHTC